jgi:O-antigen ligase
MFLPTDNSRNRRPTGRATQRFHLLDIDLKRSTFALFLTAGYFKSDPRLAWVPLDLTVASAALLMIAVLHSLASEPFRLNAALPLALVLFLLMSVSLMFTAWTPYAVEKATRFYTLTLLAFLAPVFLIRDLDDARRFFNSLAIIGLAITVDASFTLFGSLGTTNAMSRLKTVGASTISLARIAGTAGIWLVIGMLHGSTRQFIASSIGVAGITIAMLGSGSRGPLLAIVLSLFAALILFYKTDGKAISRGIGITGIIVLSVVIGFAIAPSQSRQRISSFLSDPTGVNEEDTQSVEIRADASKIALVEIGKSPFGLGWGGFDALSIAHNAPVVYPHNLLLEVFVEMGWLSGLFLCGLLAYVLYRSAVIGFLTHRIEANALFTLLLFSLFNSLVSGDLNDNRILFTLMTTALTLPAQAMKDVWVAT